MRGGDVKFMEVFGGVGSIAGEHVFDVRRNALHNIHTRPGLKSLLTLLLMVERFGCCFIEPTCASFLSLVSRHSSGRTKEAKGYEN